MGFNRWTVWFRCNDRSCCFCNPVDDSDNTVVDENTTAPINDDGTCPTGMVPNADATECVMPSPDNVGDIIDDVAAEDGAIPGFTSTLSIISMLVQYWYFLEESKKLSKLV